MLVDKGLEMDRIISPANTYHSEPGLSENKSHVGIVTALSATRCEGVDDVLDDVIRDDILDVDLSPDAASVCESDGVGPDLCDLPAPTDASIHDYVAEALRQLRRLERAGIHPSELPTIRALFVRWTIAKWETSSLPGISDVNNLDSTSDRIASQLSNTPQECVGESSSHGHPYRTHSLASSRGSTDKMKATRGIHKRKDHNSTPLGQIRGPGSCVVRTARGTGYSAPILRSDNEDSSSDTFLEPLGACF